MSYQKEIVLQQLEEINNIYQFDPEIHLLLRRNSFQELETLKKLKILSIYVQCRFL